jgi:hypothetical protein
MASINIQLVSIGLVRSVDWENGSGKDHIMPAPTTYTVTQVVYDIVLVMCKENECCQSINVSINNDAKGINPIFLLCRIKIKHMTRCDFLCLFLNWVQLQTIAMS